MKHGPTTGATEVSKAWASRPALARIVRVALFLAPAVVGWLAVHATSTLYWHSTGWLGTASWVAQALVVASAAAHVTKRAAQRVAPMSTLLNMTMVFPDHAPSRFGIALRSGNLKKLTPEQLVLSKNTQEAAEQAMALVAELGRHERRTRGHTERVRAYAELIGEEMGLSDDDRNRLRWGVLLHDVGKLRVPAHILNSSSKPTDEEWEILKQHPLEGQKILEPLRNWLGEWAFISLHHHERWDGEGYPSGLKGEEICLGGRIAAVADAYDVITSKRSYKDAMSPTAAREELVRCAGQQFDPAVVRSFLRVGLDDRGQSLGFLGGLLELPSLLRVTSSVASASPAATEAANVAEAMDVVEAETTMPTTTTPADVATVNTTDGNEAPPIAPTTTSAAVSETSTVRSPTPIIGPTERSTTTSAPTTIPPSSTTAPATSTTTRSTTTPGSPTAQSDSYVMDTDKNKNIKVLDNDIAGANPLDEDTLRIIVAPQHAVDFRVHNDHIHYESGDDELVDTLVYEICDSAGLCDQAIVTITVVDD